MILGARILSTNLSGKTANVTFLPTSGGTIDLGSQIIPFNYLNPNPYGVYQLYFSEYDYTYELNIPQPIIENNESISIFGTLTGSTDTWAIGNLNYDDFTAKIIDLNLDRNEWIANNFYRATYLGYLYEFYNQSNNNIRLVIFTDQSSNEIGRYSADTQGGFIINDLSGFGLYYQDSYNGVVKYSTSDVVSEITYDPINQNLSFVSGFDYVTKNRNFLISLYTTSSNTSSILSVSPTGNTEIDNYDNNLFSKTFFSFKTSTFNTCLTYDNSTGFYKDVKIYSQEDGSILNTFTLSADTYNTYSYNFFGKNKFIVWFYSTSDVNVPYSIYYYNGDTDVSDSLIKTRGSNYQTPEPRYSIAYSDTNLDNGSFLLFTHGNVVADGDDTYEGDYYDYLDFTYVIDGSDTIQYYDYQNSGVQEKSIALYNVRSSKTFYCYGNTGDGYYSIITIGESGVNFLPQLQLPVTDKPFNTRDCFGDTYFTIIYTDNSYTGVTVTLFNDGIVLDTLVLQSNNFSYNYTYGIFYVYNYENIWYVNKTTNSFTLLEGLNSINTESSTVSFWYTESGHREGKCCC